MNSKISEQAIKLFKNNTQEFRRLLPRAPTRLFLKMISSVLEKPKNLVIEMEITPSMCKGLEHLHARNTDAIKFENEKYFFKKEFLDGNLRALVERALDEQESPMRADSASIGTNAEVIQYDSASDQDKELITHVNPFKTEDEFPIAIKLKTAAGLTAMRKNLEDYPDAKFIKNLSIIPKQYFSTSQPGLQSVIVQVIDEVADPDAKFIITRKHICPRCNNFLEIPTSEFLSKARVICKFEDETGEECGETISSQQFKKFEPNKFKKLYKYTITLTIKGDNEFEQEKNFIALSFCKLLIGNNAVDLVPSEASGIVYVLAKTYPENKLLFTKQEFDSQIVPEHLEPTPMHRLNYILKEMHKKEYKMEITNSGELLQLHRIIQALSRLWYNNRNMNLYIAGDVSIGKTIPAAATAECLGELSFMSKESSDATKPALIANMGTTPPTPGLLVKFDDVILDEIADALTIDTKTNELKSDIPSILLGFGLSNEVERVTGITFRAKKRGTLTLFSNMNISHQAHRLNLRRAIYNTIIEKAGKANDPSYEYVPEWPKIISNIPFFEAVTGNEYIGKAERAVNSYFEQKGIHPAIGMQTNALHRCSFFCFVDSYEAFMPELPSFSTDIKQQIPLTKKEKLYYRFKKTMNELFPEIHFTKKIHEELKKYIQKTFIKYPNITIEKQALYNTREIDLYMAALKVLMRLHQTSEITFDVEQDFESLFRYKGLTISRFQYNMEEKKDLSYKKKMIIILETIDMKNFEKLEELMIVGKKKASGEPKEDAPSEKDIEEYNNTIEMFLKTGELEKWNAEIPTRGYRVTEKGKHRLKELQDEQDLIKKNLTEYLHKKKDVEIDTNPFSGLEGV